ncbi:MAG: Hpt domain-containing protein [bacterium]|nr:Hpt domain-containing protein [bacterium]
MDEEKIDVCIDKDLEILIPEFLDNRKEDISTLRKEIELIDTDSIRILGHNMRGLGGSYGFDHISEFGERIENAALALKDNVAIIEESSKLLSEYLEKINVIYE